MSTEEIPVKTYSNPPPKKSTKQRKPQTEEQYLHQVSLWNESGPTINDDDWLFTNLDQLDPSKKIDRVKILHACERAYYQRDWEKCLELVKIGEKIFNVDLDEYHDYQLNQGKRKSANLERHVIDLYNIKQRCLSKMNS
ncbi:uncharacterized protein SPAPADRAFT_62578 [Spathaspora passalidarum NRRL Y-27907]|uniref:Uncharacterized protein n=1 Tax=Spathaspora passalidarum (strain NRRL Y-27907 / 11-Y1) TaxID=619300 RepID=G3ASN1_SPAPN|nr:uncharacterized protein SPAPADRAFT_62578 [Spathaspora passalidarum NRRL Y-27907]EGW30716.1 hypothetical protein SPAPADRAFT_62578 [Spathaspora passalidarum NRRL Y-27907]